MKNQFLATLFFSTVSLLAGCGPTMMDQSSHPFDKYPQTFRLVRSGDTIYQALSNSGIPDYSKPVRKVQPGEEDFPTYNARDDPSAYPGATRYLGPPPAAQPGYGGGSQNGLVRVGNVIYQKLPNGAPDLTRPWHTLQPGEVPDPTIPVAN